MNLSFRAPFFWREESVFPLRDCEAAVKVAQHRIIRGTEGTSLLVPSKGLELEPISGRERSRSPLAKFRAQPRDLTDGAIEGTRTPTPLPVHGPEPCASANSATMALWTARQRRPRGRRVETASLFYRRKVKRANRRRAAASPVSGPGESLGLPESPPIAYKTP